MAQPEAWLRGPIPGIPPGLLPAAHALVQASEEIARAAGDLAPAELWARPGGAASVGFYLKHIAGSIDRLLTYARGRPLTATQLAAVALEGQPGDPPEQAATLVRAAQGRIEGALEALHSTRPEALAEPRTVGRQRLSTSVLGLLGHVAEHTTRHAGQTVTTAKIVRGLGV